MGVGLRGAGAVALARVLVPLGSRPTDPDEAVMRPPRTALLAVPLSACAGGRAADTTSRPGPPRPPPLRPRAHGQARGRPTGAAHVAGLAGAGAAQGQGRGATPSVCAGPAVTLAGLPGPQGGPPQAVPEPRTAPARGSPAGSRIAPSSPWHCTVAATSGTNAGSGHRRSDC